MIDIEHPDITRARRTGYPDKQIELRCPICGSECETIFLSSTSDVLGCEECVQVWPAETYFNDYEESV